MIIGSQPVPGCRFHLVILPRARPGLLEVNAAGIAPIPSTSIKFLLLSPGWTGAIESQSGITRIPVATTFLFLALDVNGADGIECSAKVGTST